MPLNDERPASPSSSGEEQGSDDGESSSGRCDSTSSSSDMDSARQSFTSDCSSKPSTPSSSPPKTLTFDEVMTSARDLSNLSLAHEIIVNRNFHLEIPNPPQNSLEKRVKDMIHKVFWDILESELNSDPPEYQHAIKLLEEIREILLSFLDPVANRMRTQIMEVLDMDLIRQQADKDAVDIQGLASYITTTMGKICAPVRDEEIKRLRETDNIVTLFREIFHILDLMRVDYINYAIQSLRPVLQKQSVEYEREKFQSILDKTPTALDHTTSWIRSALEECMQSAEPAEQSSSQGKGKRALPGPFLVINTAFLNILTWDHSKTPLLTETLMTDEVRLREIQRRVQLLQVVNEVLLIVYSSVGGPIQGLPCLAARLKRTTGALLEGMHSPDFNLEEALDGANTQICCELNKSLTERNYPALSPALQATLKGLLCDITRKDNPIRTLVEERIQQYFMALLSAQNHLTVLPQVPAGLSAIKPELTALATDFIGLVNYNKRVYGPFYSGILRRVMFSEEAAPPPASSQDPPPTEDPVTAT